MYDNRGLRETHANVAHFAFIAYIGLVAWFIRELRTITEAVVDIRDSLKHR
ncbi:hypothetical protein H1S01_05355 [Heliobacterium chlorum]|uniref:Uncharacterized protein n=1 Tax=Heliobacterium chlorum TaxID=2698 RepID=A0ABR7T316_HELCL|nr:hypothetical protein [Heliobacterium chlorum]MBC9783936.1 hypothetical protein [Heliobacterium chlorum]